MPPYERREHRAVPRQPKYLVDAECEVHGDFTVLRKKRYTASGIGITDVVCSTKGCTKSCPIDNVTLNKEA